MEYSRSASVNQLGCGSAPLSDEWQKSYQDDEAIVYGSDRQDYVLKVAPIAENGKYHCTFKFESVQEMIERTDSAIYLTMEQMALGLVP